MHSLALDIVKTRVFSKMISRIRVISVRLLQALLLLLFCLGIEKLILKLYEMKGPGTVKAWPKEKKAAGLSSWLCRFHAAALLGAGGR